MPGLAMQMLARCKIRSFLLTSGTLSPLSSFAAELQLDFPIVLENPHVIDDSQAISSFNGELLMQNEIFLTLVKVPMTASLVDLECKACYMTSKTTDLRPSSPKQSAARASFRMSFMQVWVGVVGIGPMGGALNSSYANRSQQSYKDDLGMALINIARSTPGGLLVFFPSYTVLQACIDSWQGTLHTSAGGTTTAWERICGHKQPVIEPRASYVLLLGSCNVAEPSLHTEQLRAPAHACS